MINFDLNIDPFYFFIAFVFGLFLTYILDPIPKIVIKYPLPSDTTSIYKDGNDKCYKYKATEVECKMNDSIIKINDE